jgi:hypothetical protein
MKEDNILDKSCQTVVYRDAVNPENAVSAQATVWQQSLSNQNQWIPRYTYKWNSSFDPNPEQPTFQPFNFANLDANSEWQETGYNSRFDAEGRLLESASLKPDGIQRLFSSTLYRHDKGLPMASATNAQYLETAIFTGDYQIEASTQSGYFDFDNGWQKCASELTDEKTHFGIKSVKVDLENESNDFGPSRNIPLQRNTDYIMSCWAYVVDGTLRMHGDYRAYSIDEDELRQSPPHDADKSVFHDDFSVSAAEATAKPEWQYLEMQIPASTDLEDADWYSVHTQGVGGICARVYVGAPIGVVAYIDDIRFYPADAYVTTNYYDEYGRKLLTVDENNTPSRLVEYDGFGRPVRWYKIDKTKSRGSGSDALVKENQYHLMGP